MPDSFHIISLDIDQISFDESIDMVMNRGLQKTPFFVCFANAHMIVEAYTNRSFKNQLLQAGLILADGQPVSLACRVLYGKKQERISGMDFLPRMIACADSKKARVFFYGSETGILEKVIKKIKTDYPGLHIAGAISPSFGTLSDTETESDIKMINASAPHFVFVSLGCPKQEQWMARHSQKINAVLLGIGGALPVFAGVQKRAPRWMQQLALEWFYRFLQQPRRLFKRYFVTNSLFLMLLIRDRIKLSIRK